MKKIYTCLAFTILNLGATAQGTINQITVDPFNPTANDMVTVYVDEWFSSGGCPLDNQSHQISGNTILANAHHCIGMLTVICPATDTFELGQMSAGTYSFEMVLTSGAGPIPCTPGIVIDDTMSVSFTVTQAVSIEEIDLNGLKFGNPVSDNLKLNRPISGNAAIYSITGQLVKKIKAGDTEVSVADLNTGLYFIQMNGATRRLMVH